MEDSQDPDIEITTSIRSDITLTESGINTTLSGTATEPCQFYMLSYHRDRMLSTAAEFAWIEAFKVLDGADGLRLLKDTLHEHLAHTYGDHNHPDPIKLRVLLSRIGALHVESSPIPPVLLSSLFPAFLPRLPSFRPSFRIYIAPCITYSSLYTSHKTTFRAPYGHARSHIPSKSSSSLEQAEIILVNNLGAVMEGTITTPYFFRGGKWVTPPAAHGGNVGTTRRWALETGLCSEMAILRSDVKAGEVIWLSNGVRGWGWGRVEKTVAPSTSEDRAEAALEDLSCLGGSDNQALTPLETIWDRP